MALNLGGGGDFLPYVKFNGKADKWFVRGEVNGANADIEIARPTFVADFKTIQTGWFYLKSGAAPQIIYDPSLATPAPKPAETFVDDKGKVRDCYKRGFKLNLFSQQSFGGEGLVEFTGASMHVCAAINEVYAQYEKDAAANPGKMPVVACTGSAAQKDKHGTNYKPVFSILKWVDTPTAFTAAPKAPAAANVSNTNSPPAAPETPRVTSSEF